MIQRRSLDGCRQSVYCFCLFLEDEDKMFYRQTLEKLLKAGDITKSDKIVVFCGGPVDAEALNGLGFSDVTITNLDVLTNGNVDGLKWERQDAECSTYADDEFDVAIVHAGLHHCRSPHRALLEMYRVARKAVIAFEARDSLTMKIARRAGFTPDFELEAVSEEGYETGGVANGPVPNFIYRWTEWEIEKTIRSFDPAHVDKIKYFYGLQLPTVRFDHTNMPVRRAVMKMLAPVAEIFVRLFPKQGNQFGWAIIKTGELQDWLEIRDGKIRLSVEKAESRGQAQSPTV
jgi:SAM-dependent methyltransferase